MSDQEMLLFIYGAIKSVIALVPQLKPHIEMLERHLFGEEKK